MRQVPCYLIIGNGRVARHFIHYLSLLNLHYLHWHRQLSPDLLKEYQAKASHIFVLISDQAIEAFINENLAETKAVLIHCSGSLASKLAYGVHPLMTFASDLYDLNTYQSIPFIIDNMAPDIKGLLPGINNPNFRINVDEKAKYHALCVLSGNFSCLLWQKIMYEFSSQFGWPSDVVLPYLEQQFRNIMQNPIAALTGPLVRGDVATMQKNLLALNNDPFKEVYQSFINAYHKMQERRNEYH